MKKYTGSTLMGLALAAGLLAAAPNASAAPTLDFTDLTMWGALNGTGGGNVNGLDFLAVGPKAKITTNASNIDPKPWLTPCIDLGYACQGDGLGILDDEISYVPGAVFNELLSISRFGGGGVTISQVSFLDVFIEGDSGNRYSEAASFFINSDSSTIYSVVASETQPNNGFAEWNGLLQGVESIHFGVVCSASNASNCSNVDFAVAGITVVPIPAAAWLFGSGLIGLAGIARRRKAA